MHCRLLPVIVCILSIFAALGARAEDLRAVCYSVDSGDFYVSGDVFREAALEAARKKMGDAQRLRPVTKPGVTTRCDDSQLDSQAQQARRNIPQTVLSNAYYGDAANKLTFLRLAAYCIGRGQFFKISSAIYYRECATDYVYFWGQAKDQTSDCFAVNYPTMFARANAFPQNPVRLIDMKNVYTSGTIPDNPEGVALANAMAAILIGEVARDWLVLVENYILIEGSNLSPLEIIGGHCVAGTGDSCQNGSTQDGRHPIAWGGALSKMMRSNGWGRANGATSTFGEMYEAGLIIGYVKPRERFHIARPVNQSAPQCLLRFTRFENLSAERKALLKGWFTPLLP
jgi:hypothetical protein